LSRKVSPAPAGARAAGRRRYPPVQCIYNIRRSPGAVRAAAEPGAVGQVRVRMFDSIREVIALCVAVRTERGNPVTVETVQVEVTV
jgi:hypothetical protein